MSHRDLLGMEEKRRMKEPREEDGGREKGGVW